MAANGDWVLFCRVFISHSSGSTEICHSGVAGWLEYLQTIHWQLQATVIWCTHVFGCPYLIIRSPYLQTSGYQQIHLSTHLQISTVCARLQYLQCISDGDTADLHYTINMELCLTVQYICKHTSRYLWKIIIYLSWIHKSINSIICTPELFLFFQYLRMHTSEVPGDVDNPDKAQRTLFLLAFGTLSLQTLPALPLRDILWRCHRQSTSRNHALLSLKVQGELVKIWLTGVINWLALHINFDDRGESQMHLLESK